jgi:hypothetical protein
MPVRIAPFRLTLAAAAIATAFSAHAQQAPLEKPAAPAEKSAKPADQPKMQTVEVTGTASAYDPRRDAGGSFPPSAPAARYAFFCSPIHDVALSPHLAGHRYHQVVRKFCKLDFSLAPQLVTSSSKAIETPLMRWRAEPLAIVQPLCPRTGQVQESPTQATGMPPTLKLVARVLTTLPPWDVVSPNRMTLRIFVPWSAV